MKVVNLTKLMADHGTKPRVKIIKHMGGYGLLVYEGRPDGIDTETGKLKINSFLVLGKGLIEVHAE